MGCCSACTKCVFILINVLFLIIGIVFLTLGILFAFVPGKIFNTIYDTVMSTYNDVVTDGYSLPTTADEIRNMPMLYEIGLAFFIFGGLLFIISFLGCCGACCGCCKFLLIFFAIIMICLMIGEIVVVTMFFVKNSPLHDGIRSSLKNKIKTDYLAIGDDSFSKCINLVNKYFECCGIDSELDFAIRPQSCSAGITTGCYTKLRNIIQDNIVYAGEAFAALLLLQLIHVIVAVVIYKKQNKVSPF